MKYVVCFLLLVSGCTTRSIDSGAVVSPEPRAGHVGAEILRQGGNAVDAAIAVHFALAVTFPNAGNIGGGGFMLIHDPRQSPHDFALDYRETAPARATRDMFLTAQGDVDSNLSLESALASGVPGSVRGMWEAHQRFGRLSWAKLIEPSIRLSEEGFKLDRWTASSFEEERRDIEKRSSALRSIANFSGYFHGGEGEVLRQPELAKTLRLIAERGPTGFYEGPTAEAIVAEMNRVGGLITLDDLKHYVAKWRAPIAGSYRGYRVVSMPLPSSGGICLIQMLRMFEELPRPLHKTLAHLNLVAEIEKRVFADRSEYDGDSDFIAVQAEALVDKAYCRRRAGEIDPLRKTDPSGIKAGRVASTSAQKNARHESSQTTHFSIVDRDGMAVANTTTLNGSYGNGIVVPGAGFLLNNEMDDFSAKPGTRNLYGVTGGLANQIEPAKRMLSSMCPTFVYRPDGNLWLVLGTPGGSTIFTTVFQVITNRIDYGMNLQEAVDSPRFHHQWPPAEGDPIQIEDQNGGGLRTGTVDELKRMGYTIKWRRRIGDVQAIEIDGNHAIGAADPRGIGTVGREIP